MTKEIGLISVAVITKRNDGRDVTTSATYIIADILAE